MNFTDGIVGMAGQFVAAVLQTAGLYGQSQILANFEPVFGAIGAMMYVWVGVGALMSVALFGNYRQAAYLFMGPALFWWMLTSTIPVKATANQFGVRQQQDTVNRQLDLMRETADPQTFSRDANVSEFFVYYDNLVSEVMQGVVQFLVDTQNKEDLIYAARERALMRLINERGTERSFVSLLNTSLVGECGKAVALSMELSRPPLSNAQAGSPEAIDRQRKQTAYDQYKLQNVYLDSSIVEYVKALGFNPPANPTCEQIWQYTRKACITAAEQLIKPTEEELAADGRVWTDAYAEAKKILNDASQSDQKAIQVVAAFYLRNSIAHSAHGKLTAQMAGHGTWFTHVKEQAYGTVAAGMLAGVRASIVYFAGSIPYLQGLLLYVLTAAFPFFAIFLIMPNRASSFFVWMSLWFWVKSWDVGFAFVAFMRDIFWDLMPHAGATRYAGNFNQLDWDNPASVFNVVHLNDPTSHLNTYYTIIGILTLAVPVVTAHLCMGATNLWGGLKNTIDTNANRFQNEKSNSAMRHFATLKHMEIREQTARAKLAAGQAAANNPGYTSDGVYRGQSLLRGGAMDGTLGRHVNAAAARAEMDQAFGDANIVRRNDLSMYTGRRMDFNHGKSADAISAAVNRQNEQDMVSSWYEQNYIPGLATGKAVQSSRNTDIGRASGGWKGGTDGDG